MNQLSTLHPKDLQSLKEVSRPLNEGIVSIGNICKSLRNAQVDPTTDTCYNYNEIREHIECAEESLKTSEQNIKRKLGDLDQSMELLTREKQNVEQQKKYTQMAIDKLHIEKNSAEELLNVSKAALQQAENKLESAKHALRVHQDRRNEGEGMAIGGGVLLAIPIIGWIAGPILLSEGLRAIERASADVSAAEKEQQESYSQVADNTVKVSEYQGQISRSQNDIQQTNDALKTIEGKIEEVQKNLKFTADFQQMVRRAVDLLSVLSGRVAVLETQTRCFIQWGPVVKAMEDVMKAVTNVVENRLFYSQGVPGFLYTLKENVVGLLALCNSPNNTDKHDSYY